MNLKNGVIEQLESLMAIKSVARRAEILHKVTDLFVLGSGNFSDDQVKLFDDVMERLLENIDVAARAQFGNRLAVLSDAPRHTVRMLAFDDEIEVAGPILKHCERLDEKALIESAKTKSQGHLLAISSRKRIAEPITDVLLERGNETVVSNTAKNSGARFSDYGIYTLVNKARYDADLAESVWSRPDIPRQNLVRLFVEASEAVKRQLVEADPRRAEIVKSVIAEASDQIQTKARLNSNDFAQAQTYVGSLHSSGGLDETKLLTFAREGSFDKVAVALALMCDLPIGLVERALVEDQTEQVLILAKAINLSWVTTVALLLLKAGVNGSSRQRLDQCFANFSRLQPRTAQTALQFYRMREQANRSTA